MNIAMCPKHPKTLWTQSCTQSKIDTKKLTFIVVHHVVQGPDHEHGETGLEQVEAFFLPRRGAVCK